jgi:cyclopropane fatty-acyl-phospholipid synthase-like methyltransferase
MTSAPGNYDHLVFNAPLSEPRADRLATGLSARAPATVLDLGCGWAELLLRIIARCESAHGIGIDSDEALIARGRAAAAERGLAERVELRVGDAAQAQEAADVVVAIGVDHIFGRQPDALAALHRRVRPGGVVLLGAGYWQRGPTVAEAAAFESTPDELTDLGGLVELAVAAGFRPLDIQTAGEDEWNAFESGFLADWEEWLMRNPPSAGADAATVETVRARADTHRRQWLHGYRGVLGFAYLTLGVPAPIA